MMIGDHNYSMSSVDENDISNVSLDTTTIENSDSGSSCQKKKKLSKGRQCVSYGCNNYQYSIVNGERINNQRRFFKFPNETTLKNEWCRLIKRVDGEDKFNVSSSARFCDVHFRPEDITTVGKLDRKHNAKPWPTTYRA